MQRPIFSILITTKNRIEELTFTLKKIESLISRRDIECIICVDGSSDHTASFLEKEYPQIKLLENEISIGLIGSRNRLLKEAVGKYAISLDDDAHLISINPLKVIKEYFKDNPNCGVIAARIFWGKQLPVNIETNQKPERVRGFVGCGHVWNMETWREIPNYPDWFVFYGEEDFASYQLFKKGWQVHYVPRIFVQHRVEVKDRKNDSDYIIRLWKSLRSSWYNYILFLPWSKIPRRFMYTLWMQVKLKVLRGNFKAGIAIFKALFNLAIQFPRLMKNRNALNKSEFKQFQSLAQTKIYWHPEK